MKKVYILAAVAAVLTGVLLFSFLSGLEKKKEIKPEYETVVVAAQDIPPYTPITAEHVQAIQLPKGSGHEKAVRSTELVIGKMAESVILKGEQILAEKLKTVGENQSGLAYVIPKGKRAMTIAVDDITGVAGFIRQGDCVDILLTLSANYKPDGVEPETPGPITTVLAQNILVAALDKSLSPPANSNGSVGGTYTFLTLIVTQEETMRITEGSKNGQITLLLRAAGDDGANTQPPIGVDALIHP